MEKEVSLKTLEFKKKGLEIKISIDPELTEVSKEIKDVITTLSKEVLKEETKEDIQIRRR